MKLILSNGSTTDVSHGLYNDDLPYGMHDNEQTFLNDLVNSSAIVTPVALTSSYIPTILPRPRPSLDGLGVEWQNSQQYFTALSLRYTWDKTFVFGDYATFPNQSTHLVYSICENGTTAQLWWVNNTMEHDIYSVTAGEVDFTPPSVGPIYTYTDTSCGDWFRITSQIPGALDSELNEHFLKDPENYECVSQDIYQWVSTPLIRNPLMSVILVSNPLL